MRKKRQIMNADPLFKIGYYFELLRIRLMRLDDYALRRPYPENLSEKIILIEISYVQIRKILELVMFMSVSAHEISEIELSSRILSGWNAEKLMGWMSKVSQHYFPHPIDIEPIEEQGIAGQFVDASARRPCLDPDALKYYYARCGEVLHEQVDVVTHNQMDRLYKEASDFFRLTTNLFETFSFEISIGTKIVLGHLHYGEPRPPQVFYAGVPAP